ncbi:outer membrane protein assembly factor BamB [Arenicella xantha]|uniref:Outer membrane protein assembly factor BamB n=1 Tax=Arenicella xantha TaxID=644221 RepID=A0A395JHZ4_9GAMM|nr:outer membrane protein assembly factor BamB [Arenicella xantha]RBP49293.1 Beta-barrel assembly machine subunit BamB [Arenicella xantha]
MNKFRLIMVCSLLLMVAACGGKSKKTEFFGPEEKPKKPKVETTTKLKRNWSHQLGKRITPGDAVLSPALLGEYVYAAAANGRVEKIAIDTGKTQWSFKLKDERITAGVGVGGGLVLTGTGEGIIYALNQDDGELAWKAVLDSEVLASPVIEGSVVVARTGDGKVYGLSAFDGSRKWTISRQLPKLTLRGDSRPVVTQGVVFAGFSDGLLAAIEAETGRALWDFPISFPRGTNDIDRLSDIDTNPLLVGDHIYVSSYQEVTHALDIPGQKISWSTDVSSYHSLAYDAAFLYISDKNGVIHQINRSNGNKTWSQTALRLFPVSAPVSVGPYVVVSEGDGGLYILSKQDGRLVGKHSLGAKTIIGEPAVDSDTIFILDSDGALQSLSLINNGS